LGLIYDEKNLLLTKIDGIMKTFIILILLCTSAIFAQPENLIANVKHQFWGQVQYVNSQETNIDDSFLIKRFRLGAKGDVLENLKFAFLFEMAGSPYLMQGWLDYTFHPMLNIRVGQFKYPFGIENYVSATLWDFVNPSFVTAGITSKLGYEGGKLRDIGVQLSGQNAFSKEITFKYFLTVMNGNGINTKDNNKNKDFVGRVVLDFNKTLNFGASYFGGTANDPNGPARYAESAFGIDAKYINSIAGRKLKIQGEYISGIYNSAAGETKPAGFYAYLIYELLSKQLEAGFRYDSYKKDSGLDKKQSRMTLGLSYYLAEKQKINFNYELIENDYYTGGDNLLTMQFQFALQ